MKRELKFNEDGSFKILQFTDVHWSDGSADDIKSNAVMESILILEKPDLVVFTGDMVFSEENAFFLQKVFEPVDKLGIPWATVFGNHDAEIGSGKEKLLQVQQESKLCLTDAGDLAVSGLCNYYLSIKKSQNNNPSWILYFIDSGSYNENEKVGEYDFIQRDQIDWYTKLSKKLNREFNGLPALSFFHIPLPEYNDVWDFNLCFGSKNEDCCCPKQNSGMFSAMLEMGDVKGVFVGHDHINDYYGDLYGIKLCYGRATGYNTYGEEGFPRGARVIRLKEGFDDFETWIRLEDGSVIASPLKHNPEGRNNPDR